MGRTKGGTNREWSKEEKYNVLKYLFDGHTYKETQNYFNISNSQLETWLSKYKQGGIEALQNKCKPGNPLLKYSMRKELTDIEQLEYKNMLLRIENERLKKGYTQEDAIKAKKKSSEKNTK